MNGGGGVLTQGDQVTPLDCTVRVLEAETGKELQVFKGHTNRVTSVAFTPDGRHVLSGSQDKTVRVWHVDTGKEVLCCREHADTILSLAVSSDGRRVLSAGDAIRLWDLPPNVTGASANKAGR